MCRNSIEETVEKFSNILKNNIKERDSLFEQEPSDLLDLAYAELIGLNSSVNSGCAKEETVLNQALELVSIAVMLVDQMKDKQSEE